MIGKRHLTIRCPIFLFHQYKGWSNLRIRGLPYFVSVLEPICLVTILGLTCAYLEIIRVDLYILLRIRTIYMRLRVLIFRAFIIILCVVPWSLLPMRANTFDLHHTWIVFHGRHIGMLMGLIYTYLFCLGRVHFLWSWIFLLHHGESWNATCWFNGLYGDLSWCIVFCSRLQSMPRRIVVTYYSMLWHDIGW